MKITKERFISLDVLRGITIIGMILVNAQGVGKPFSFLRHSSWNGCTPADFVFPFFIFIVGAAIHFAFKKTNFVLTRPVFLKIVKRGALIFFVGFLLNIFPFTGDPEYWRIMGVLQRIGIVYIAATLLIFWLKTPQKIAVLTALILLVYWGILYWGGDTLENNLTLRLDRYLFGNSHLYGGYGIPFDPEGLLSSLPAVANALIGYLSAVGLLAEYSTKKRIPYRLLSIGAALIAVSYLWNLVLPFNKPLWSSSFVLFTSGWAIVIWVFAFYLIDIKKRVSWTSPFLVFGTNALFTYLLSDMIIILNYSFPFEVENSSYFLHSWLDDQFYAWITDGPFRPMLWGITVLLVCWAVTYPLYKKRIFIKL